MITADTLKTLTELGPKGIATFLAQSGYTGCAFEGVKFIGITNGGQFCYKVTFFDDAGTGENEVGKVFLTYDQTTGAVVADF